MNISQKIKEVFSRTNRVISACTYKNKAKDFEIAYDELNEFNLDAKSSSITKIDLLEPEKDVSIIITTYNRAEKAIKAIESAINQDTNIDFEVIVVNDGSTDNTKEVLKSYEKNNKVTIINQENKGLSGARNTGIAINKGQYIIFLDDDDDELTLNAIDNLYSKTINKKYDIVEGGFIKINKENVEHKQVREETKDISQTLGVLQGFATGKLYKRDIFKTVKFPEKYWFEDSINSGIIHNDICAYVISNPVYKYYDTPNSITSSLNNPKNVDSLYITMQLLEDRKTLGIEFNQASYEYFLRMINLTYSRTRLLTDEIKYNIFVVQCYLYEKYYKHYKTQKNNYLKKIEASIVNKDYKSYVKHCELHI